MRVLIVEDHYGIRVALEMLLEMEGYSCVSVDRCEAGLTAIASGRVDLVLLDLNTNGISADEFMARLKMMACGTAHGRPKVGVLSASPYIEQEAVRIGADFWVRKPFEHEELLGAITRVTPAPRTQMAGA